MPSHVKNIQNKFKKQLHNILRYSDASISEYELTKCFKTNDPEKLSKWKNRLFNTGPNQTLIWKPRCHDTSSVLSLIKNTSIIDRDNLIKLFTFSKKASNRSQFPFIAPCNHRSKHIPMEATHTNPVIGVDILVRPPCEFTQEHEANTKNNLYVGRNYVVVIIHGHFDGDCLKEDSSALVRMVAGDNLFNLNPDGVVPAAIACENEVKPYLYLGNIPQATTCIAKHLNHFVSACIHSRNQTE